jgi:hypothetical protein
MHQQPPTEAPQVNAVPHPSQVDGCRQRGEISARMRRTLAIVTFAYRGANRLKGVGASTVWPLPSCTRAARRILARP